MAGAIGYIGLLFGKISFNTGKTTFLKMESCLSGSLMAGTRQTPSKVLKNNKDIVLDVPESEERKISGDYILAYVGEKLKNNKEVVIDTIKKDGVHSLQYASEAMHNNKEVIIVAIREYKGALEYASEQLQQDPDIKAIINAK